MGNTARFTDCLLPPNVDNFQFESILFGPHILTAHAYVYRRSFSNLVAEALSGVLASPLARFFASLEAETHFAVRRKSQACESASAR